jgi:Fe2+ transport system protein FeoA
MKMIINITTLWGLKEGSEAVISNLSESIPQRYRRRLRELGFHVDERVSCVRRTFAGGPRLYRVGNCVYSLESEIAGAIEINEAASSKEW